MNSLFLVYAGLLLLQILSILFSGRKRLNTRKVGKSSKHNEIKKIQAGKMKTKLRVAFENLVKLKSLRDKKWQYYWSDIRTGGN